MTNALENIEIEKLSAEIRRLFPDSHGAYLFGSAYTGNMRPDSDIDLAILQLPELMPDEVLALKSFVSRSFRRDTDVVDLYRADSVTAAQVVTTGLVILNVAPLKLAEFETMALSRYALLNEERAEILKDIQSTGTIYGR